MSLVNEQFKIRTFANVIRKGGKLASEEQAKERISVCDSCPFKGMVEPIPTLKIEGCTKCGCPFITKAHMLTMLGTKIKCPHPEGNKWEQIDNKFKTNKK